MTTNPTEDPPLDVSSGAPAPRLDLQSRIKGQRAELMARLARLTGDVRPEAAESRDRLKARLSELSHILKWGVVDGWANLGAPLTDKLEQWLTESARQLVANSNQRP